MRKENDPKNQSQRILVGAIIFLAAILLILLIIACSIQSRNFSTFHGRESSPTETTVEKNADSIAIPGYEILELKAGSKKQSLCLPNPAPNLCYFQIYLYLDDGTLLWQSELIEPGETSKPIILTQELKKGTYPDAILKYACFEMDGVTPLNGAQMKLTLWVK